MRPCALHHPVHLLSFTVDIFYLRVNRANSSKRLFREARRLHKIVALFREVFKHHLSQKLLPLQQPSAPVGKRLAAPKTPQDQH